MRRPKFETPAIPGPFPELSGTTPGVLDPEQPSRLLRTPQSILSFASFDPEIAIPHGLSRLSNLSLNDEERCRAKRIVIETIPGHGSFWRWVPRARKRDHVFDEGTFPRLVDICGKTYLISQDQWDIYKLDPCYDCFVDDFSRISVITKKDPPDYGPFYSSSKEKDGSQPGPHIPIFYPPDEDDDKMVVDDDNASSVPGQTSEARSRNRRRSPYFNFTNASSSSSDKPKSKRAANVSFQTLRDREDEENEYFKADSKNRNTRSYAPKIQKRARTLSPSSSNRILSNHRMKREKDKQTKWEAKKEARRRYRDQNFLREVFAEVPQSYFQENRAGPQCPDISEENEWEEPEMNDLHEGPSSSAEEAMEEAEAERLARLEESRRKMAELNADRPKQRQREQLEREEEPVRRARTEAPQQSTQDRERAKKEEAQRRWEETVKQQQQARQRRAALLERLERERLSRHEQWERGPWSDARAIERYKSVSEFFDKARFSPENLPLTWIDVPWPVLSRPSETTVSDISPESVARFFLAAKWSIRGSRYKEFVKLSFNRFHPDRWGNRRLFDAIIDEGMRQEIETASASTAKFVGAVYNEEKAVNN